MKDKIAVVTGATGYIGSKLCYRLIDDGWIVHVLCRDVGRNLTSILASKVTLHVYDGSTESVQNCIRSCRPEIVFHLASLCIVEHRSEQVTDLIASNVLYGVQLIEACVRNDIKYFINTGTSWQHYRSESFDPVCLYAATKQAFEDILDFYTDAYAIKALTLKLFDTYGPHDNRPKLVNLLINSAKSGELLKMTPGEQHLDLVHIDDVCNAFIHCSNLLTNGLILNSHERYVVSSSCSISVKQLVELVGEISGKQINAVFGARAYRAREVMRPYKGGKLPEGWFPEIDIRAGLAKLIFDSDIAPVD